jgi:transmembrane sensor
MSEPMNTSDEQVRATIAEQAGEWFAMHRASALDATERRAFAAWIKTSPLHVEEYLGVALVARDLPAATDDPEMSLESVLERAREADADNVIALGTPQPQVIASKARPRTSDVVRFAAAAAVIATIGGWFLWWNGGHITPQRYATRHGEQRSWRLADDSVLRLDTDTAVTVRYGRHERRAEVEYGRALFEVVHEAGRSFRVLAGSAEVVAVGTQFSVYRQDRSTLVTVVQGQVDVTAGNRQARADVDGVRRSLRVSAGEQLRVKLGFLAEDPTRVDVQRSTAWLRGELAFEQQPLEAVAAEFNRYGALPIKIETPALRTLTVSGVFAADDTESFIAFLRSLEGVGVEVTSTRIRVFGLSATTPVKPETTHSPRN